MANELNVNADGLRMAAASSDATAAALAGTARGVPSLPQPSSAGVAAVNAALSAVQGRQSNRIADQADHLAVSGARYDTTDSDGADSITTVSV
ncbi:hypothetical protein ACT17_22655 [Mycolicibacterium conceptionense]|uniref:Uncharacterized protein n=1 Tax=Mycolicibacterium conceptionense TaxID=451644 RepID=A0A0J8U487_9MYCO|nr:hypothetical protein [Mycolicibacterium conceptionense]KMV15907.1 hypothetical protein ACT17_22655 [Mycolicibacterium conceptionense]